MPEKAINAGTTQRSRKGAKKRSSKHNVIRQRGQGAEAAPEIIADSIFALTLPIKSGAEVYFTHGGHETDIEHKANIEIYNDLYTSFEQMCLLIKGEETRDTHKLGLSLHVAFNHMLLQTKLMIPSGFEFNIEYDERCKVAQKYYFVVYHYCEWPRYWLQFEIGKVVKKLIRNKPLHDLFLSFLKGLGACGINFWNEGYMGNTLESLDEHAYMQKQDNDDPEEYINYNTAIKTYDKGPAGKYRRLIKRAATINPGQMAIRARRFKKDNEIANLIYQGCHILEAGCNLNNYRYMPDGSYEDYDYYLDLDSQCNIIWEWDDPLTSLHREYLDNDFNNGYSQEPAASLNIRADTKEIDFIRLTEQARWTALLANFFQRANELIDKYIEA